MKKKSLIILFNFSTNSEIQLRKAFPMIFCVNKELQFNHQISEEVMAVASSEYSVDEGKTVTVEFKRVGGSVKKVTVTFQTAPGTAVHGKNYEDVTKTLIFEAGDSEPQFIDVKTIYHEELTGDLKFYEEIVDLTDSSITGFNHSSTINIIGIQNHKKLSN